MHEIEIDACFQPGANNVVGTFHRQRQLFGTLGKKERVIIRDSGAFEEEGVEEHIAEKCVIRQGVDIGLVGQGAAGI